MKKLNEKQYQRLIKKAKERQEVLGWGSSRAVFGLTDNLCIKIAMDEISKVQNTTEIDIFSNYKNAPELAKIFAYNENVIVMERLKDESDFVDYYFFNGDYIDVLDEVDEYFSDYEEESIQEVINFLNICLGECFDNYQIGRRKNGEFASFDYGYDNESETECVGNIGNYFRTSPLEILDRLAKN